MGIEQYLQGLGLPAIGFVFLYFMLKQNFKVQELTMTKFDNLCKKMEDLVSVMNDANTCSIQRAEKIDRYRDELKNMYLEIKTNIESLNLKTDRQNEKISELSGSMNNAFFKLVKKRIPILELAVSKSMITEQQRQELLKEQQRLEFEDD